MKSRWFRPFTITQVFPYGVKEVTHPEKGTFKANAHLYEPSLCFGESNWYEKREEFHLYELS